MVGIVKGLWSQKGWEKAKRIQGNMHLSVSLCCGSPALTGTQPPDFIHGKTFKEPGDRVSENRLHPWVMCQPPEVHSDSVPVLNLVFCLSDWTPGHSKVKLKLLLMKKWRAQKGSDASHKTWLSNLTLLLQRRKQSVSEALGIASNSENLSLFVQEFRIARGEEEAKAWYLEIFPHPRFNKPSILCFPNIETGNKRVKSNTLIFFDHVFLIELVIKWKIFECLWI